MRIRALRPKDYLITPWKNGRGTTTQIAIFPENASLQKGDFLWRVSMATIFEDGLFSRFPGFNRFITVLEGEGVRLHFEDREELLSPKDVLEFSGEREVRCVRLGTKVRDLNLIFRKTLQAHFEISSDRRRLQTLVGTTLIVFVKTGAVDVTHTHNSALNLQLNETIVIEFTDSDDSHLIIDPQPGATYALMQIQRHA
jgi:environmental stress-induced protein Ves